MQWNTSLVKLYSTGWTLTNCVSGSDGNDTVFTMQAISQANFIIPIASLPDIYDKLRFTLQYKDTTAFVSTHPKLTAIIYIQYYDYTTNRVFTEEQRSTQPLGSKYQDQIVIDLEDKLLREITVDVFVGDIGSETIILTNLMVQTSVDPSNEIAALSAIQDSTLLELNEYKTSNDNAIGTIESQMELAYYATSGNLLSNGSFEHFELTKVDPMTGEADANGMEVMAFRYWYLTQYEGGYYYGNFTRAKDALSPHYLQRSDNNKTLPLEQTVPYPSTCETAILSWERWSRSPAYYPETWYYLVVYCIDGAGTKTVAPLKRPIGEYDRYCVLTIPSGTVKVSVKFWFGSNSMADNICLTTGDSKYQPNFAEGVDWGSIGSQPTLGGQAITGDIGLGDSLVLSSGQQLSVNEWSGTKAEFAAIDTKDPKCKYYVTDDPGDNSIVQKSDINGNIKINGAETVVYTSHSTEVNLMDPTTHRIMVNSNNMTDLIKLDVYYDQATLQYRMSDIYIDETVGDSDVGFIYKVETSLLALYDSNYSRVVSKAFGVFKWDVYNQTYTCFSYGGVPNKYLMFDVIRPTANGLGYTIYTSGSTQGLKDVTMSSTNGNIRVDTAEVQVYRNPFTQVGMHIWIQDSTYHLEGGAMGTGSTWAIVCSKSNSESAWITTSCSPADVANAIAADTKLYMVFINNPGGAIFDTNLQNQLKAVGASKFSMYDSITKYGLICHKGETMEYINFSIDTNFGFVRSVLFSNYFENRILQSNSDKVMFDYFSKVAIQTVFAGLLNNTLLTIKDVYINKNTCVTDHVTKPANTYFTFVAPYDGIYEFDGRCTIGVTGTVTVDATIGTAKLVKVYSRSMVTGETVRFNNTLMSLPAGYAITLTPTSGLDAVIDNVHFTIKYLGPR